MTAQVITVTSGKGGVGKTTTAVNLALALAVGAAMTAGFVLLFAVIAGADLFVSNFNSDELSNMGVERRS